MFERKRWWLRCLLRADVKSTHQLGLAAYEVRTIIRNADLEVRAIDGSKR